MRPVTIGVDARTFYYADSIARGIGHYSRYHLMAVAQCRPAWQFICYAEFRDIPKPLAGLALLPNVTFRLIDEFSPDQVDILHLCDPMSFHRGYDSPVRLFKGADRITATFYDLIPLHLYFPTWSELQRTHYRLRLAQFVESAITFLAISGFTGADLIKETGVSPERVRVIMAGLNASPADCIPNRQQVEEALQRLGIAKPFFLHVGALDPHKNFDASATAFLACRERTPVRLVVVGEKSGALAGYEAFCAENRISDIIFTGFISREDLEILYQEAVALLFMSKFEGFGFPVLEAMARGCPVITSNVTSIPEVAGDAAILLAPEDTAGIRDAMLDLLLHPARTEDLRRKGRQQAAGFTWQKTAEKTIAVWDEMLGGGTRESGDMTALTPQTSLSVAPAGNVRVLLDISVLGLSRLYESAKTGVFRVVENLAHGLAAAPEIDLLFCSTQHLTEPAPDTIRACQDYLATNHGLSHVPFFAHELPPADIFHSPFHALPDASLGYQRFLTVCDLIPVLFPEMFKGKAVNPLPRILASLRPADHVLCISRATKRDVCQHLGVAPERAHVTPLAASQDTFHPCCDQQRLDMVRLRYAIPGGVPYILGLGTLEPRKNVDHVIRSFARLVAENRCPDLMLVLVGTKGWNFDAIFQAAGAHPSVQHRIVFTGFVPDDELSALYSGALAFVYMSRYEGFGLPPLEAMQCGVPVIAANTSSLPEVVGDGGILLDPDDQDELCRSILELYHNQPLRRFLALQAIKQARTFSWDNCVRETITAYKAALDMGRR